MFDVIIIGCGVVGAAAAYADEGVKIMVSVVVTDNLCHIHYFTTDRHFMRFIATGAEDGATPGKN